MPDGQRRRAELDSRAEMSAGYEEPYSPDKHTQKYRQIWPELDPDSPIAFSLEMIERLLDFPATYDQMSGAIMGSPLGKSMTVAQVDHLISVEIDQNHDELVSVPEYLRYVSGAKQLMAQAGRDLRMPHDNLASGTLVRQGSSLNFSELVFFAMPCVFLWLIYKGLMTWHQYAWDRQSHRLANSVWDDEETTAKTRKRRKDKKRR